MLDPFCIVSYCIWKKDRIGNDLSLDMEYINLTNSYSCYFTCTVPTLLYYLVWYDTLWAIGRWLDNHATKNKNLQVVAQVIVDQTLGVLLFFPTYFYAYELSEALVSLRGACVVCVCAIIEYYQCLSDGWVNKNPRYLKQDYLSHTLFTFYIIYSNTAPLWSLATQKLVENLGSVFLMQYKVWPLVNYFVFKFVPERMRVLTSNLVSVFWNAYLCTRLA